MNGWMDLINSCIINLFTFFFQSKKKSITVFKFLWLPCYSLLHDILSQTWCLVPWWNSIPYRYQPFPCLRPYVSAISASKITFTTTTDGCLQKLKLLWYIPAYVCTLFGPIDNTWACSCFFFLNKGEMLPYAWKNKRRPKLTAPSAIHSWRQKNGPHSTFLPDSQEDATFSSVLILNINNMLTPKCLEITDADTHCPSEWHMQMSGGHRWTVLLSVCTQTYDGMLWCFPGAQTTQLPLALSWILHYSINYAPFCLSSIHTLT